ncbi:MAG: DUF3179 domain-containing protein [Methyloligellaceae bacterium]
MRSPLWHLGISQFLDKAPVFRFGRSPEFEGHCLDPGAESCSILKAMENRSSFFNLKTLTTIVLLVLIVFLFAPSLIPGSGYVTRAIYWSNTDFSRKSVNLSEIISGGPKKDGIPSIDRPEFISIAEASALNDRSPVISFAWNDTAKAYPLGILMSHEIVNDKFGDLPVAVTYCPLCNASIVFEAQVDGRELKFGTTGNLRNSDLVMYDRQTQTWWQQFTGEAIVGELTGTRLKMLPSRVESFARFKSRYPHGKVLKPWSPNNFGSNPYAGYDTSSRPFLYNGPLPDDIHPMARVVVVNGKAWTLELLRNRRKITVQDIVLRWEPGQSSALDTRSIARGREVGNVIVQKSTNGELRDAVHDVTFAFVFHAFHPDGKIVRALDSTSN